VKDLPPEEKEGVARGVADKVWDKWEQDQKAVIKARRATIAGSTEEGGILSVTRETQLQVMDGVEKELNESIEEVRGWFYESLMGGLQESLLRTEARSPTT
jgi:hypothetical protein